MSFDNSAGNGKNAGRHHDSAKGSYIPTATYEHGAHGRSHAASRHAKGRRSNASGAIIALVVVAALFGGGTLYWFNRPIEVTVNGSAASVKQGSTIAEAMEAAGVSVTPGNLTAVDGSVLAEGEGWPFSAIVGGRRLADDQAASYQVREGDRIEVTDGVDRDEEYSSEETSIEPRLVADGSNGSLAYVEAWGKPGRGVLRRGKTSGKTTIISMEEPTDCVIAFHNPKPDNGEKLVALTFDDGPGEYTERFLDVLSQHGAKGTFFCLGTGLEAHPELAKKIVDSGNQIASHTSTHPQLSALDAAGVQDELGTSFADILSTTGVSTTTFRPPYGDLTFSGWLKVGGVGTVSVTWTQDSEDWRKPGVEAIVDNCLRGVGPGSIILMHDGGVDREQGLEALGQVIDQLKAQGYRFVTISELMASDSSIPAEIATCSAMMPTDCTWPAELAE